MPEWLLWLAAAALVTHVLAMLVYTWHLVVDRDD
jgi:hypothetical protein